MSSPEKELEVLQTISQHSQVRQRDIARIVGTSLGMTNAILKRLAQKGLISVRKINNRNIHYVVSTAGMEEIARRSYRYLRRTIKNVVYYKHAIGEVVDRAVSDGYDAVVLVGKSDLDFIVEHWCIRRGLDFRALPEPGAECKPAEATEFFVYSENLHGTAAEGSAYLRQVLAAET